MKKWIDREHLLSSIFSVTKQGAKSIQLSTLLDLIEMSSNVAGKDDFGFILTCAVRYALGRETYAPAYVISFITPLIPLLSRKTLTVMKNDITEAHRWGGYGNEQIDKPDWMRFLNALETELKRRASEPNTAKVIAVDFDGCLCTKAEYPEIGMPNWDVIDRLHREQERGAKVILWTCREGVDLEIAVRACTAWGLTFDSINESLPEWVGFYGTSSRKVGATEYWDDRAVVVKAEKGEAHET